MAGRRIEVSMRSLWERPRCYDRKLGLGTRAWMRAYELSSGSIGGGHVMVWKSIASRRPGRVICTQWVFESQPWSIAFAAPLRLDAVMTLKSCQWIQERRGSSQDQNTVGLSSPHLMRRLRHALDGEQRAITLRRSASLLRHPVFVRFRALRLF